ncbi:hypothetical protein, partial [Escherichia coli]|uniref:hypothetical protein n=1 Tax=Escherichia coli TaxID=562 RepID=UPI00227F0570
QRAPVQRLRTRQVAPSLRVETLAILDVLPVAALAGHAQSVVPRRRGRENEMAAGAAGKAVGHERSLLVEGAHYCAGSFSLNDSLACQPGTALPAG